MDITMIAVFFCFAIPLACMLFLLKKEGRLLILLMIIGAFQFMFSKAAANVLFDLFPRQNEEYIITSYVPLIFELSKAVPLGYYIFVSEKDTKSVVYAAIAESTGFAVLESLNMITTYPEGNLLSALCLIMIYVLANIICTGLVGIGLIFIARKARYFLYAFVGLLTAVAIIHGMLIMFIEAEMYTIGAAICILMYIPILLIYLRRNKKERIRLRA